MSRPESGPEANSAALRRGFAGGGASHKKIPTPRKGNRDFALSRVFVISHIPAIRMEWRRQVFWLPDLRTTRSFPFLIRRLPNGRIFRPLYSIRSGAIRYPNSPGHTPGRRDVRLAPHRSFPTCQGTVVSCSRPPRLQRRVRSRFSRDSLLRQCTCLLTSNSKQEACQCARARADPFRSPEACREEGCLPGTGVHGFFAAAIW